MATGSEIFLTQQQYSELSGIAQSRTLPAGYVFRAKLILMLRPRLAASWGSSRAGVQKKDDKTLIAI